VLATLGIEAGRYLVATVHRAGNTDERARLTALVAALGRLDARVIFPVHPRTRAALAGMPLPPNVRPVEPLGYLDMLVLVRRARMVLTDSGGVQKEAFFVGTPCLNPLNGTAPWLLEAAGRLLPQLNTDHNRAHDVIEFEVPLWAVGMSIVATGTRLGDGQIGIDRFKISCVADRRDALIGTIGVRHDGAEPDTFKRVHRHIAFVDRPKTDQPVLHPKSLLADVASGFL
jgi:hypothetical protein